MYRLLVVDDEQIIVNGISNILRGSLGNKLSIYSACGIEEALKWIEEVKIDIVLTDIRMPGMSGLELQDYILDRRPDCKIIFLTGFNDFEYVKAAIRKGSVDYILKNEDESRIIEAVEKAMLSIDKKMNITELISTANRQMKKALPSIRRDFLWGLLQGDSYLNSVIKDKFSEFEIPLCLNDKVLLVLGRVHPSGKNNIKNGALLYAVQNIAADYLKEVAKFQSLYYDKNSMVWLIQPKKSKEDDMLHWRRTLLYVHNSLERIQERCKENMKLNVSFLSSSQPIEWEKIDESFNMMKIKFSACFTLDEPLILVENRSDSISNLESHKPDIYVGKYMKRVEQLKQLLDKGCKDEFINEYAEIHKDIFLSNEICEEIKSEVYLSILVLFYDYINKTADMERYNGLPRVNHGVSWTDSSKAILNMADKIFSHHNKKQQGHTIINEVKDYIARHLDEDLSLQSISEFVYLNPSYLSRMFKKYEDESLSLYIAKARILKAKELLANTNANNKDIAISVGFSNNPSYFYRLFKKMVSLTPTQYRELKKSS